MTLNCFLIDMSATSFFVYDELIYLFITMLTIYYDHHVNVQEIHNLLSLMTSSHECFSLGNKKGSFIQVLPFFAQWMQVGTKITFTYWVKKSSSIKLLSLLRVEFVDETFHLCLTCYSPNIPPWIGKVSESFVIWANSYFSALEQLLIFSQDTKKTQQWFYELSLNQRKENLTI